MSVDIKAVDDIYFRVAKVRTFAGDLPLTNATGFFYMHDCYLYLVTSRHVVLNEVEEHRPDHLRLSLHSDKHDLRQRTELSIPLYKDGLPQWYQHPRHTSSVDVVAVAVNNPHVSRDNELATFTREDIVSADTLLPLGQQVLILGFPLGFHDTVHNLPIVRNATVATSFSHPFKAEPYFLTDARLHRGMSGSPVIVQLRPKGGTDELPKPKWHLLGIHSSALDVSDRDPEQDEKLALNSTWYASLLPEIIPASLPSRRQSERRSATHR